MANVVAALSEEEMEKVVDEANRQSLAGNYKVATELYEACLSRNAKHFPTLANFAIQEMELGHAVKAMQLYERALALNPQWFDGQYNLANLYVDLGPEGESKAIEHYLLASKLNESDPDVWNNLSVCMNRAGRLKEALEYAVRAMRLDKTNALIQANLAELYNQTGDIKKALFFASKSSSSSDTQVIRLMANLFVQMDELDKASECFEKICAQEDALELPARIRFFSLLTRQGKYISAMRVLEQARNLYAKQYPSDKLGCLAFDLLLGKPLSAEEVSETIAQQKTLSHACEMLVLHLNLPNAARLTHKCQIVESLKAMGLQGFLPETVICQSSQEVLQHIASKPNYTGLWYLKDPAVQRGQGITILETPVDKSKVEIAFPKGRRTCLQEEVIPLLLDGRKFGVRIHVLVVKDVSSKMLSVKMCQDGILTKCGKDYSENDTSALAQITCTSVQRSEAGFDRKDVKGPASQLWPGFRDAFPQIEQAVLETVRSVSKVLGVLSPTQDESSEDAEVKGLRVAQLFGYDFIFAADGKPVFLEANASPQFQDSKAMDTLLNTVAFPLLNGLVEALMLDSKSESTAWPMHGWKDLGQVE